MDTEANGEGLQPLRFEFRIERVARGLGRKGGAAGSLDMVALRAGRVPEYHDRIADELVDRTTLREEGFGPRRQMARRLTHQQVRVRRLSNAGEISDIGKKDRDFLPSSPKLGRDRAIDDPLHDIRRDKVRK